MKINANYLKLKDSYLFSTVARKVKEFKAQNPKADVITLGIGDVTLPLPKASIDAMHKAVDDQSKAQTFHGYGEEQGYSFLRETISAYYRSKDVCVAPDEIFISDGAKSDLANFLDICCLENSVLVPDPVYPVYLDTNIMHGRSIAFAQGNEQNGFLPLPEKKYAADLIYICSPNNPTGAVYNAEQLKLWVDFALENNSLILFDAAYEAFICDKNLPTSIYQIEGARECAVEFCSLSKTAGFTGTRCGYTVVPRDLSLNVHNAKLNKLWLRRQTTKFNGVSYIVQRGAEAVFSEEGLREAKQNIAYYLQNAKIIGDALNQMGIWFVGGKNSPYIWLKCPADMLSWDFFDLLLKEANVVGTPGAGFGENGEGFFRLTAFNTRENIQKAVERLKKLNFR
jgi:LL-diaminopimelate aminotransferase